MFEKMKFILSQAWDFLAPFIRQMMTAAGPILMNAALTAVTQTTASMQTADGAAKRAAAFDMIKDDLEQQGLALATSTINAAIEAAVLKLKDSK